MLSGVSTCLRYLFSELRSRSGLHMLLGFRTKKSLKEPEMSLDLFYCILLNKCMKCYQVAVPERLDIATYYYW